MPLHHPGPPPWIMTYARPSKLLAADGVTLKDLYHATNTHQTVPLNGDRLQSFLIAKGDEIKLTIGSYKNNYCGIFDIYLNDVLDSGGYDDYAAAGINTARYILLTQPIRAGKNIIEFRVNGKNVASTGYYNIVFGVSVQ